MEVEEEVKRPEVLSPLDQGCDEGRTDGRAVDEVNQAQGLGSIEDL